ASPHKAVNLIALAEQKLREISAVLTGDARDQSALHVDLPPPWGPISWSHGPRGGSSRPAIKCKQRCPGRRSDRNCTRARIRFMSCRVGHAAPRKPPRCMNKKMTGYYAEALDDMR